MATTIDSSTSEGTINVITSIGSAQWLKEMTTIPESADGFIQISANSYKLAAISKIKNSFEGNNNFNIEGYLENEFSGRLAELKRMPLLTAQALMPLLGYYMPQVAEKLA